MRTAEYKADEDLVTHVYEQCWQKSKGRYNNWIPGRLNHFEFTFYLVLNALERTLMDGALAIVDHDDRFRKPATGFTLFATAAAFEDLGLTSQAAGIRELSKIFPNGNVPEDRKQLDAYMEQAHELNPEFLEQVHRLFVPSDEWQGVEQLIYRRLARYVRDNPDHFLGP